MLEFIVFPVAGGLFWYRPGRAMELLPASESVTASVFLTFYLAVLCIWLYGARRAYGIAAREVSGRFGGVTNPLFPFFCSLLVPGWGQFLNGQGRKGSFFLLVACAGFFMAAAIPGIFLVWGSLEPSVMRRFLEWVLAGCLAFSPVVILLWIYAAHDALRVCLDDLKKESIRNRIECALNRVKFHGWRNTVLRGLMRLALFGFSLALAVGIASRYLPGNFYLQEIGLMRDELKTKQMTVIPGLIDMVLDREGLRSGHGTGAR
jgi:hypothetical protein